jgi:hypothetical protein
MANEEFKESEILTSFNNKYNFTLEYNGNLAIFKNEINNQKIKKWSSFTNLAVNPHPYKLKLHANGNLVLYDAKKKHVWSSNTSYNNDYFENCYLIIQNNGRLTVKDENHNLIWESKAY